MSQLRISLLGTAQLAPALPAGELRLTRTLQALLGYLLVHRHRTHPREVLAGLFWGDSPEEHARNCLNTALWRLRRMLEPEGIRRGTYLVKAASGEIGFNADSDFWLDVQEFEVSAADALDRRHDSAATEATARLEGTLDLYVGDLLEGFYDDWVLRERLRLQSLYCRSLEWLMHHHRHHGALDRSLGFGLRLLDRDPLREEIHRDVILLFHESGQRPLALRQYERCREILAAELGIAPMEETQDLYRRIAPSGNGAPATVNGAGDGAAAMVLIQSAIGRVAKAQDELRQAMQLLQRDTGGMH